MGGKDIEITPTSSSKVMIKKVKYMWFKDLIYMIGLWFIGQINKRGQADLMEEWVRAIRRRPLE